jgi:hypothetical protein
MVSEERGDERRQIRVRVDELSAMNGDEAVLVALVQRGDDAIV